MVAAAVNVLYILFVAALFVLLVRVIRLAFADARRRAGVDPLDEPPMFV